MAYNGGININQSFSLQFRNLSGYKQEMSLFELGNGSKDAPETNNTKTIYAKNVNKNVLAPLFTFFRYDPTLPCTSDNIYLVSDTTFVFTNVVGATTTPAEILADTSLTSMNGQIQSILDNDNNFKNQKCIFTPNLQNKSDADDIYLDGMAYAVAINDDEVDWVESITLNNVYISVGAKGLAFDWEPLTPVQRSISTNNVEVIDNGVVPYAEILESQNGSVYDVKGMTLDLMECAGVDRTDSQMQECMRWEKKNANGNDMVYYKCPARDMYSQQNTYGNLQMGREADKFTLDGMTKFVYPLESGARVKLSYEYISLNNLLLDSRYTEDYVKVQEEKLKKGQENSNFRRVVVADENVASEIVGDAVEEGAVEETPRLKKKTNSKYNLLLPPKMCGYWEGWYYSLTY